MAEEERGCDGPLAKSESGVPEPRLWVMELLHQCDAVVPGQLCKRRLHNQPVWPGLNRNPSRWSRLITHYPHLTFRRYLTTDGTDHCCPFGQIDSSPIDHSRDRGPPALLQAEQGSWRSGMTIDLLEPVALFKAIASEVEENVPGVFSHRILHDPFA